MKRFSAGVGKGQKNNPSDVAMLQLIGKILKDSSGRSYYSGVIDGKDASGAGGLGQEIAYSRNLAYFGPRINTVTRGQGDRLFALLPPKYQKYSFHFLANSYANNMMAVEAAGGSIGSGSTLDYKDYNANNLYLPNIEAKSLLFIMASIAHIFKFFLKIEKIGVSGDGRFFVRLGISGGKSINLATGSFDSNPKIGEPEMLKLLETVLVSNKGNKKIESGILWKMVFKGKLVLKTKKAFRVLRNTHSVRMEILKEAGFQIPSSGRPEESPSKCYAAYENARMLGELDKDTEEFFFQCFGDSRDAVLQKQETRKAICLQWLKELKSEAKNEIRAVQLVKDNSERLNELYQQKAEATGTQASMVAIEVLTLALGQLKTLGKLIDSALEAYSKGPKNWHGKGRELIQEAIVGSAGMAAEKALGTLDEVDVLLFVAGLAVTAFFAPPIGFALGVVITAASIIKTLYETWTYEDKIDEEIKLVLKKYLDSVNQLEIVLRNVEVIKMAMAAESCFTSKADYDSVVEGESKAQ